MPDAVIDHGQVDVAVAGEVARGDRVRAARHRDRRRLWNVPSPLPSRMETSFEARVGDGQVGAAVAVEVAPPRSRMRRSPPARRRITGSGMCRRRCPAGWSRCRSPG